MMLLAGAALCGAATARADVGETIAFFEKAGGVVTKDDQANVVGVNLAQAEVTDADLEKLTNFPHLARLDLWGANVTDRGMDSVAKLAELKNLSLENTEITAAGLEKLKPLRQLRVINLRRCSNLTDEALAKLATFADLEQLLLLYNNFSDSGLAHLSGLAKLKVLDLRGCVLITDDGLPEIKKLPNLQRLKLRNSPITDRGLKTIGQIKTLKGLSIEDAAITSAGLAQLKPLVDLDELYLMRDDVTDAGLAHLAGSPKAQTTRAARNPTGWLGLTNLKGLDKLLVLDVAETQVTDAGVAAIKDLAGLERLDLWFDPSDRRRNGLARRAKESEMAEPGEHQGHRRRTRALESLSKLETLSLATTAITDEGLAHLANLGKLKELDLRFTKTTDAGVQKFQAAHLGVQITRLGKRRERFRGRRNSRLGVVQLPKPTPSNVVLLLCQSCLVLVPSMVIETKITPRIRASITAYSTDVAAELSAKNRPRARQSPKRLWVGTCIADRPVKVRCLPIVHTMASGLPARKRADVLRFQQAGCEWTRCPMTRSGMPGLSFFRRPSRRPPERSLFVERLLPKSNHRSSAEDVKSVRFLPSPGPESPR